MPEGDTVFRTARSLHRALAGHRLVAADLRVPRLATADLTGWTVSEVASRGKHLLLRLRPALSHDHPPATLHSHLGMDGSWRVQRVGQRWRAPAHHEVRAVLRAREVAAVGYRLKELALLPTAEEERVVGHLGPDLLEPVFDAEAAAEAVRRLAADPTAPVVAALRDQRNLAGLGNVYCAELLFLRGVWPWTPVGEVPELAEVVALARRLLVANRDRATRSTTGSLRRGETSYVYGRAGAACRRCLTLIEVAEQSGRVTYWCPSCQSAPARAGPALP